MSAPNSLDELNTVLEQARRARTEQDEMRADTLYVRATQFDPKNAAAWVGRAATSSDPDDAMVARSHALDLSPQDTLVRAALAEQIEERITAAGSCDSDDLVSLGRGVAQTGQKSLAHRLFVRATELTPHDANAWVWRAGSADSLEAQVSALNQALALDPENERARAGLRWILEQQVAPTQFASPQMVRHAAELLAEGQLLLGAGEFARARDLFIRASELDHCNETAWLWRASTAKDVDQALLFIEQALRLDSSNAAALEARRFLQLRKLRIKPMVVSPVPEPIAPIRVAETSSTAHPQNRILLWAMATTLLLMLIFTLLKTSGIIR